MAASFHSCSIVLLSFLSSIKGNRFVLEVKGVGWKGRGRRRKAETIRMGGEKGRFRTV